MWLHFTGATKIKLHKAENGNKSLQQASFCFFSLKLSGKYDHISHLSLCILLNQKKKNYKEHDKLKGKRRTSQNKF